MLRNAEATHKLDLDTLMNKLLSISNSDGDLRRRRRKDEASSGSDQGSKGSGEAENR